MSKLYRTESNHKNLWRDIKVTLLVLIIATLLIIGLKTRMEMLHPEGEYGKISENPSPAEDIYTESEEKTVSANSASNIDLSVIPEYSGTPTYVLNGNKPEFTEEEYERAEEAYIELSEFDSLGRCGPCMASLGKEMLDSAGERRDISQYTPSGWKQASYPDLIEEEEGWLYHRSHLIAHMFAGAEPEIDGPKNLITGTEYMNEKGMLPYCERAVQNWLIRKANGGRVIYRVTPVFSGSELVCRGVHIEAADLPTRGSDFHINVYCYNVEPGITIDYATGRSWRTK